MSRSQADNDSTFDTIKETAGTVAGMARDGASDAADTLADVGRKASAARDVAADAAAEIAQDLSARLKTVGIDTDVMVNAAKDRASGLRQFVSDEMQTRPLRTLGLAAAAGLFLGFLSSR
ncbi:MAG: hypothetical protein Q8O26_16055 [Phreatobacter sp.]|uniref:hypothetical protein n=1 Tax=Phreatobacter sp. TaxID=1966341 RepID=UPI0027339705|nr:hypothetical protein [Phreatobacter sp.]MDP2803387.1 hypothetical protein [Phreatobacter sp.]